MTHEHWSMIILAFLVFVVVVGFAWSILREVHFSRIERESRSTEGDVVESIREVHGALVKLCERLEAKSAAATGHQDELRRLIAESRQLILDVERRLHDMIRDNRDFCSRKNPPAQIFNTNADGGQTNQGQHVEGHQA